MGLFVLHKFFEMLLTILLIVGSQYGILFAKVGEEYGSSQRENYEKESRRNSGEECGKVFAQSPGRVASYNGNFKRGPRGAFF